MRYSIEPRERIYVKGYAFLSFAKNIGKGLSNKYRQKLLDNAKKSITDAIKTESKRAIQKIAEGTGDLTGNKIVDKITSFSKSKIPNNNDNNNNINNNTNNDDDDDDDDDDVESKTHKKRFISPEERKQITDELRLVPKKYV